MKLAIIRCDFVGVCRGAFTVQTHSCKLLTPINIKRTLYACFVFSFFFWLLAWSSDYEPCNTRNGIRTIWFIHVFFCSLFSKQTLNSAAIDWSYCESSIGHLNSKQHFLYSQIEIWITNNFSQSDSFVNCLLFVLLFFYREE